MQKDQELVNAMERVAKYLVDNSTDLPPDMGKLVNDNFWELLL